MLAAKQKILRLISQEPGVHGYVIASELRLSLSTVYEHLKALEGKGYIVAKVEGRRRLQRLTSKGEMLLSALR